MPEPGNVHNLFTAKSREITDSYALDDGLDYSPDKFYTQSKNGGDDGDKITLRVPRGVTTQIDEWIGQRLVSPYRTRQDFYRDAIFHRMHWVKEALKDPATANRLQTLFAETALELRRGEMERRLTTYRYYKDLLRDTLANREWDLFHETLAEVERDADAWPECKARDDLAALARAFRMEINLLKDS